MRVLSVDDDCYWGEILQKGFAYEGVQVDLAEDGREGVALALEQRYDAILVDVQMPEMDGFAVVQKIREAKVRTPILMVSCQGQERDKIKGLRQGADDYLVKPVPLAELVTRIQVAIRRVGDGEDRQGDPFVLTAGGLSLHLLKREVLKDGVPIPMTKTEFILLECFLRRPGQVFSRPALAQHIQSGDYFATTNVIDVHVKNIRDKIDHGMKRSLIRTVRGIGYTLETSAID